MSSSRTSVLAFLRHCLHLVHLEGSSATFEMFRVMFEMFSCRTQLTVQRQGGDAPVAMQIS